MSNLIKKDISKKTDKSFSITPGKKIHSISVNPRKYRLSSAIFMGILSVLLIATFVRFIFIFRNWLVISISVLAIASCLIWMILALERSLIKVEYTIYDNCIVKSFEDCDDCADHSKFVGYKLKTSLIDKMFKPKTSTLILFYNDTQLPYVKLSCIQEDVQAVVDILLKTIKQYRAKLEHIQHKKMD